MMDFLNELGIKPIINARGNWTTYGGSFVADEVQEIIDGSNEFFVDMDVLFNQAGDYIANKLGCESAYITSGCGAALALSVAACITHDDTNKIADLPFVSDGKSKILFQKNTHYIYDRCFTLTGGQLLDCGTDEKCTIEDIKFMLESNSDIAAIGYYLNGKDSPNVVALEDVAILGKSYNIPVIVDAASQVFPIDYMKNVASSADLVCFSGKYVQAPQSTGFVCGRSDLIKAIRRNSFIGFQVDGYNAIGRGMKVDRQEAIGLAYAVNRWVTMDHDERIQGIEKRLKNIQDFIWEIPNIKSTVRSTNSHSGRDLYIQFLDKEKASQIINELIDGDPSIHALSFEEGSMIISGHVLKDKDTEIVGQRLFEALMRSL